MRRSDQRGFTMLEMMAVLALLVPMLSIILRATSTTAGNMIADDNVARCMENLQRSAIRIAAIIRPASISTYRMEANQVDVDETQREVYEHSIGNTSYVRPPGSGYATSVGEWIEPADGAARTGIRFRAATGKLSMNASALTPWRTLRFEMDAGEIANGSDDDGDGLVDEGAVVLDYDGTTVRMNTDIEQCTFNLEGRTLTILLQSGSHRRNGMVQRFTHREVLFLRNN